MLWPNSLFCFVLFLIENFPCCNLFALIVEFGRMPSNQLTTPRKKRTWTIVALFTPLCPVIRLFVCLSVCRLTRGDQSIAMRMRLLNESITFCVSLSQLCALWVCCVMPKIQAQDFFKFKTVIVISKPSMIYLSRSLLKRWTALMWINNNNNN